jgi:hypothetical protein
MSDLPYAYGKHVVDGSEYSSNDLFENVLTGFS